MALALRAVAASARLDEVAAGGRGPLGAEEHALLAEHIVAYRLDGPLVFAAAHRFLLELTDVAQVRVVILRMARVSTIDATGARVLGDAIAHLERRGIVVLLSGVRLRPRGRPGRARRRRGPAPPRPAVRDDARGDRARARDRPRVAAARRRGSARRRLGA